LRARHLIEPIGDDGGALPGEIDGIAATGHTKDCRHATWTEEIGHPPQR
jgi:hypothetical protein